MNADLELSQELAGHSKAVRSLAVLKNGMIASGGVDALVCLWARGEESTFVLSKTLQHHTDFVYCIADGGSGDHFYTGGKEKLAYKVDYAGNPVLEFLGHEGAVCSCAERGNELVTGTT